MALRLGLVFLLVLKRDLRRFEHSRLSEICIDETKHIVVALPLVLEVRDFAAAAHGPSLGA